MGALGLLAVWGGHALPHRTLTLLGAGLLSGMLVVMGIEAIPHGGPFTFRGAAAILKGAAFILLGAVEWRASWYARAGTVSLPGDASEGGGRPAPCGSEDDVPRFRS